MSGSAKRNGVDTVKLQATVDVTTARIVDEMVGLGIHGSNRAEVASWIIRVWIWENMDALNRNGIQVAKKGLNLQK